MSHTLIERLRSRVRRRFRFLFWPAAALGERALLCRSDELINPVDRNSKFPLSMMRYWWTVCVLQEEAQRLGRPLAVVDLGCGKGTLPKYTGNLIEARWLGLDIKVELARLTEAGYDELHACDFDRPLPVSDAAADVVVSLHVLEHVANPAFTLGEVSRILRPGGVLLAGSPVAPRFFALAREWWIRRKFRQGKRRPGDHRHCFWPGRWAKMIGAEDMGLELLTGTYLLRWAGNPLENTRWWLRLNQLWGGLFPSLGGEVYVKARVLCPAQNMVSV